MGSDTVQKAFLRSRANSIEGGTSEVMRNILGERVLGLPGDVRVDREVPVERGAAATEPPQARSTLSTSLAASARSSRIGPSSSEPPSIAVAATSTAALQLADVPRRREVLVLFGDAELLDAVPRRQAGDHRLRRAPPGADAPAVTPTVPDRSSGSSSDVVDAVDARAARFAGQLLERPGVGRVGRADDDDGVAPGRHGHQRRLAVRGGEAEVRAPRRPEVGEALLRRGRARRPSRGARAWSGRGGRPARRTPAAPPPRRPTRPGG